MICELVWDLFEPWGKDKAGIEWIGIWEGCRDDKGPEVVGCGKDWCEHGGVESFDHITIMVMVLAVAVAHGGRWNGFDWNGAGYVVGGGRCGELAGLNDVAK